MANKNVFNTQPQRAIDANTVNNAGGAAYALSDKEALAQLVMTGTFNGTFYTTANNQIDNITALLNKLGSDNAEFVAKLAVYARKTGFMKDTPAFLVAWLSKYGTSDLFKRSFDLVINNGKMLSNFVQIMRSGAVGRKSLGTAPKKKVQDWIVYAPTMVLLRATVGQSPSLADIFKMVHPRAQNPGQAAFFKWVLGYTLTNDEIILLPSFVQYLIAFRNGTSKIVPNVPFELLTSCELSTDDWKEIAINAGWQMIRMNLNTFERKGVFTDSEMVDLIASRLQDATEIAKANVMPYQIFTTWMNVQETIPVKIKRALEYALNESLSSVPRFEGKTLIFVDVSGSMESSITGTRKGSTSKMRCVDVAALFASSMLRVNSENTQVVMFDTKVHDARLNNHNSVMDNAKIVARFGGGGTMCQLPLIAANNRKTKADLIIYISDNESWMNSTHHWGYNRRSTEMAEAWAIFKKRNSKAKMVCIDLQPGVTTQAQTDSSVLNIGGFNDSVYKTIQDFISNDGNSDFWTQTIEGSVNL